MREEDKKWLKDVNFIKLCDIVAKNKLVCLTGSGISKSLKLKNGNVAPDWNELLINIKNMIQESNKPLSADEKLDVDSLLSENPTGESLIEAASILYKANPNTFALRDSTKLKCGETSEIHKLLLNLDPKGILTYNYDLAHENAINEQKKHIKEIDDQIQAHWLKILPSDKDKIVNLIKYNVQENFYLKCMGQLIIQKQWFLQENHIEIYLINIHTIRLLCSIFLQIISFL